MTVFRSDFSYLASIILHILIVELIALSDLRHLSTYELIKDSSGLTVLYVIDVKSWLLKSTISTEHILYGPFPLIMMFSENSRSSPCAVSMSLPRIILCLPLVNSSTWHIHVTIFGALNSVRHTYTFNFFEVVNLIAWFSYIVSSVYFVLSFDVSLPVTIVELILLANRIRKFLNFSLLLRVFMKICRIGE